MSFQNQTALSYHTVMQKPFWIFDMDGTLTIAQHDFDAIREELGLPEGLPILESLEKLPTAKSKPLHEKLNQIELEIAHQSKPAEGAADLLETLLQNGSKLGLLTRNNALNIEVTLKAAGLFEYFESENLLSRDCINPKPAPDGINKLLSNWRASSQDAVMVGDHLHDLLAGRNAQALTLYVDQQGKFPFKDHADICIQSLSALKMT
ncbi:HAD family hydrolase [uncultured Cocleimonas sp.]|uniref:HAD family hydrolase n=1 Tax=uncultured Cocleimonas sp. TaxID=1051587 RepID=UPI00260D9A56|nr:HAD family hydrolase [uncultured Cocleimonas sp.]